MPTYLPPIDDRTREPLAAAPRPASLRGQRVGLLDIAKPRSTEFLDRMEAVLTSRDDIEVVRLREPTPSRPAPAEVFRGEAREQADALGLSVKDLFEVPHPIQPIPSSQVEAYAEAVADEVVARLTSG